MNVSNFALVDYVKSNLIAVKNERTKKIIISHKVNKNADLKVSYNVARLPCKQSHHFFPLDFYFVNRIAVEYKYEAREVQNKGVKKSQKR